MQVPSRSKYSTLLITGRFLLLAAIGVLLNFLGSRLNGALSLPFFLDNIGTILVAATGGYLPAIAVGFFSNILMGIGDTITTYYCFVTVLIAVAAAFFARKKILFRFPHVMIAVLTFGLTGGILGGMMTWFLNGFSFGEGFAVDWGNAIANVTGFSPFASQLFASFVLDIADKAITTALSLVLWLLIPGRIKAWFTLFRQERITKPSEVPATRRKLSLRAKVVLLVGSATVLLAAAAISVSIVQYHNNTVEDYTHQGECITEAIAANMSEEQLHFYEEKGKYTAQYQELTESLKNIYDCIPELSYVYAYRIREDGVHVIFDLDTPELAADLPGDTLSLNPYMRLNLDKFCKGEKVAPVITNDEYGWQLTVYRAVNNAKGENICYIAADMSMSKLASHEIAFLTRIISVFLSFLTLTLVFALFIADRCITEPINRIAHTTGSFAYDTEQARSESLERLQKLDIHTGDEIENLYLAVRKTSEDTVGYIEDVRRQGEQIEHMQNGLIMVLADLVESRDKCTGDHIRKTAAYTKIIMEQMKKDGIYADVLTDEYMQDVIHSAPLHDIGKIHISDALLNKPGKLTDEEFKIMQSHTTAGGEIISSAIETIGEDSGYLKEARNLAEYHHEKWNGKGYPHHLIGEDIPLSARIMAVADVFDALLSRRSYKPPFTVDKAIQIIREEAGTHFDEKVVEAFLHAEPEIRKVAEDYRDE